MHFMSRAKALLKLDQWDRYEKYYWLVSNFAAFGHGFQINTLLTNATQCFYRVQNNTHTVIPEFFYNLSSSSDFNLNSNKSNAMLYDFAYMGSAFLHNFTDDITYCTSALNYSMLYFSNTRLQYQQSCKPLALFSLSVVQNLVSNVLSLFNIRQSYKINIQTLNRTGRAYDFGRALRILLVFPVYTTVDFGSSICQILPDYKLESSLKQPDKVTAITDNR